MASIFKLRFSVIMNGVEEKQTNGVENGTSKGNEDKCVHFAFLHCLDYITMIGLHYK